ncbi:hypothetical protein PVT68_02575 [Microbulbifer bruguierae]|uniref:Uncharacterized protein n=1 Tax=Microbulbifer bruguierae TaxID=3029061 RepID=A0ABY8NFM3_9GAMM|nr:hypothetical protein [Microbulbifer bruguierae]WGL17194.1 hypothetical protein PVT68_02575 [Microbulbifer bruguierae]
MKPMSCRDAWQRMSAVSAEGAEHNYAQLLDMSDFLVETELFPRAVLEAYSAWNLGKVLQPEQERYFSTLRGGGQGDYRDKMPQKIANVIDCLTKFPESKRAIVVIPNNPSPDHVTDDDAKCMREIQFYFDNKGRLCATVFFRAQAALIFPKNIHFIGSMMREIAVSLPQQPSLGALFYLTTFLVADRS